MPNRSDFMQGFVIGTIAGIGIAALSRSETGQRFVSSLRQPRQRRFDWNLEYSQGTDTRSLLRQRAEAGGNPANLAPEKSETSEAQFERLSGAPGTPTGAERINVPGRPGLTWDLSNPKVGVNPAARAIHMDGLASVDGLASTPTQIAE